MRNNYFPNTKIANAGPQTTPDCVHNSNTEIAYRTPAIKPPLKHHSHCAFAKQRTQPVPQLEAHRMSRLPSIQSTKTVPKPKPSTRANASLAEPSRQFSSRVAKWKHGSIICNLAIQLATWQSSWQPDPNPEAKSATQQPKTKCCQTSTHPSSNKLRLNRTSSMNWVG